MISWPFKTYPILKMEIFDKRSKYDDVLVTRKSMLFLDVSLNNSIIKIPNL